MWCCTNVLARRILAADGARGTKGNGEQRRTVLLHACTAAGEHAHAPTKKALEKLIDCVRVKVERIGSEEDRAHSDLDTTDELFHCGGTTRRSVREDGADACHRPKRGVVERQAQWPGEVVDLVG